MGTLATSVFANWVFMNSYEYNENQMQDILLDPNSLIGGYILQMKYSDTFVDFIESNSFDKHKANQLISNISNTATRIRYQTVENEDWFVGHRTWNEADGEWEVDELWNYIEDICLICNF